MSNPISTRQSTTSVTVSPPLNVDGKGASSFLVDWDRSAPRGISRKPGRQILAELFTSMLILSASFKYRPVVGVSNYLYRVDGGWSLSLVSPDEWSSERRNGFAGTCVLQNDMTWTIRLSDQLHKEHVVVRAIGRFYDAFVDALDTDLTLEEVLPFYSKKISYFPRLHASALSRSLSASMKLGGQTATNTRRWRALLPAQQSKLLAREA